MVLFFLLGATLSSYLMLRLLMVFNSRVRKQSNGAAEIALSGLLVLLICTVAGGYGMKDDLPVPQFYLAFSDYLGPAMTATVIELVRLKRN